MKSKTAKPPTLLQAWRQASASKRRAFLAKLNRLGELPQQGETTGSLHSHHYGVRGGRIVEQRGTSDARN